MPRDKMGKTHIRIAPELEEPHTLDTLLKSGR